MTVRPLNYTTVIPSTSTAAECIALLAEAGAHGATMTFTEGRPTGLSFRLDTAGGRKDFILPVDGPAMQTVIRKALGHDRPHVSRSRLDQMMTIGHAWDVAWRVVRDWLEAQLALIAAQMATLDQVMLPYLEVAEGETLYHRFLAHDGRLSIAAS